MSEDTKPKPVSRKPGDIQAAKDRVERDKAIARNKKRADEQRKRWDKTSDDAAAAKKKQKAGDE